MHASPVITVEALQHAFGTGEARAQVLFDLDLTLRRGELVVMKGASGSGKTTLLTLLACLRRVQQGRVDVLGTSVETADEAQRVRLRRRMGFIFQAHNLHPALSAIQNVRLGLELHGGELTHPWQEAAAHALDMVGLRDRHGYLPKNLSGGQKQRVAVARALVGNPDLVFADEPTAALDAEAGGRVLDLFEALALERGTTLLVVTHDQRVIDRASRVVTLADGRIVDDRTRTPQS